VPEPALLPRDGRRQPLPARRQAPRGPRLLQPAARLGYATALLPLSCRVPSNAPRKIDWSVSLLAQEPFSAAVAGQLSISPIDSACVLADGGE
jgi:hypothetical protein